LIDANNPQSYWSRHITLKLPTAGQRDLLTYLQAISTGVHFPDISQANKKSFCYPVILKGFLLIHIPGSECLFT